MSTWDPVIWDMNQTEPPPLLRGLAEGEHPVVVLRNFFTPDDLRAHQHRAAQLLDSAATTRYANGALTTVGPYLAKHLSSPGGYFTEAKAARDLFREASFGLAATVRDRLRDLLGLSEFEPAREPDGSEYCDGVVRIHADGVSNPLHNDNIARDAADTGLRVTRLVHQLSCVVCVSECTSGGELRIYRKRWAPGDEAHKVPAGLGYSADVLAGAQCHEFRPQSGDVYLIDPTHYHEIMRVGGASRVTLGFFFAFADESLSRAAAWA
jgi:hypothetical protein